MKAVFHAPKYATGAWPFKLGRYSPPLKLRHYLVAWVDYAVGTRPKYGAQVGEGEAVAGIPDPMTRKDLLKISGMTEAQLRHCERVAKIAGRGWFQLLIDEQERRKKKVEKAMVRELYRLHRQTSP